MSENRSKSARVRAICDHARTRRASPADRIARIRHNLSARDFARSMNVRQKFALAVPLEIADRRATFTESWRSEPQARRIDAYKRSLGTLATGVRSGNRHGSNG